MDHRIDRLFFCYDPTAFKERWFSTQSPAILTCCEFLLSVHSSLKILNAPLHLHAISPGPFTHGHSLQFSFSCILFFSLTLCINTLVPKFHFQLELLFQAYCGDFLIPKFLFIRLLTYTFILSFPWSLSVETSSISSGLFIRMFPMHLLLSFLILKMKICFLEKLSLIVPSMFMLVAYI